MWLVAAVLDSADIEHFHHHREFCCLLKHGLWTSSFSITGSLLEIHSLRPTPNL